MSIGDIPMDEAVLLAVLLESLLYGFSLLMCGGTIWTLFSQRCTYRVNLKMLIVACLLLLFSTAHLVIDIIRTMEGLIFFRDTYPGGPIGYFSEVSQWTVYSNYVYVAQTLIGDGVVLYRCYVVWKSKLVMILPVLLYCTVTVTGILSSHTAVKVTQNGVFAGVAQLWITSFWVTALATNLLTTLLLVCRIWHIDRKAERLYCHRQSQLRPILRILVEAGAIYSLTLIVALTCFLSKTKGQYVVLAMVTPIISITFYMVIIGVGLSTRVNRTTNTTTLMDHSVTAEQRQRMQVRITTLTQSKADEGHRSLVPLTSPTSNKNPPAEIGFDGIGEAV